MLWHFGVAGLAQEVEEERKEVGCVACVESEVQRCLFGWQYQDAFPLCSRNRGDRARAQWNWQNNKMETAFGRIQTTCYTIALPLHFTSNRIADRDIVAPGGWYLGKASRISMKKIRGYRLHLEV